MKLSSADRESITSAIRDKYAKVAHSLHGQFKYPTGREGLDKLGYAPTLTDKLPPTVQAFYCGVGNPFAMGRPQPGDRVVDIGCGAGVDTLLAAFMVGPKGEAIGVEFSLDMLNRARENLLLAGIDNARFVEGTAEALPLEDKTADLVVSNGVFNLVVDKDKALAEAFRILKPGGRFQIADQILTTEQPASPGEVVASWFK